MTPSPAHIEHQVQQTAVLIHGLSETRSAWARQIPSFEQTRKVIAYDVRGFGTSPVGAGNGSVEQFADDLAQILSARRAGPSWLVGFSMGGVIAQRFALDFPDLTAGLVLIASSCTVGRPAATVIASLHQHGPAHDSPTHHTPRRSCRSP